ncbi:MAG TPA: SDR family NAD(P)-dependent oxidoreductase [Acidimicrobiales bacterium]
MPARRTSKGTAIVIGVGPGLGLSLARTFAEDGYAVAMIARSKDRLEADAQLLTAAGHRAAGFAADAGDPAELGAAISEAVDELGASDVLLYNAGVVAPDTPSELSGEEFARRLAVNVVGAKVAADSVLPLLREGRGSLLFTGGDVGTKPSAAYTSLSVGKAGLRAFAYALHEQLRPSDIHATILTIFGAIGSDEDRFAPDTIARAFLGLHHQPKDQWGPELVYP